MSLAPSSVRCAGRTAFSAGNEVRAQLERKEAATAEEIRKGMARRVVQTPSGHAESEGSAIESSSRNREADKDAGRDRSPVEARGTKSPVTKRSSRWRVDVGDGELARQWPHELQGSERICRRQSRDPGRSGHRAASSRRPTSRWRRKAAPGRSRRRERGARHRRCQSAALTPRP